MLAQKEIKPYSLQKENLNNLSKPFNADFHF